MREAVKAATRALLGVAGVLAFGAPAAALDLGPREPALRAGVSLDPDQFHAGFEVALGPPRPVRLRPGLDLGLGNGVRILSFNGDVVLSLGRPDARVRPFLGGGPGLSLVDVTSGVGEARGVEAELVGHVLGGVVWTRPVFGAERLSLEVRAGFGDTPDVKITAALWF